MKGLLGTKLGMTQTWDENNRVVPVTVIAAGTNVVTQVRTPEKDGYNAVQIGFGEIDGRKVDQAGRRPLRRRPGSPRAATWSRSAPRTPRRTTLGQELTVDVFAAGEVVDVTGTSKGKGFAGVMKRTASTVSAPPTVPTTTTASRARSAAARPRVVSSRACGWPAGWVATP